MVKTASMATLYVFGQAEPIAERASTMTVLVAVVLLLLVLVGLVILRAGRRMRRQIESDARQPTQVEDIWRMHKLPEDGNGDGASGEEAGGRDVEGQ